MNKLLGKKKAAPEPLDQATLAALESSPQVSPGFKKPGGIMWKKSKKIQEPKPSFDLQLSSALPSSDAFRTSLLMPNLSARFSMLREQDDPSSKLGKASDDSVLQPSRRPRMADFGYAGSALTDIAEVQSIHGSIRPPFAYQQTASEDGYGSESDINGLSSAGQGSIMGRARPGEGNTMFGGRQKVYKIAPNNKVSGLGKAVYEDDIGTSAFQRWRRQDREQQSLRVSEESMQRSEDGVPQHSFIDPSRDMSHSSSWMSDNIYSNTSSVARSDTRSSTAATSIVSQPGTMQPSSPLMSPNKLSAGINASAGQKRHDTKNRRLYEAGLDQHILDQQASATSRLNSFRKNKALPHLQAARSAGNLYERSNTTINTSGPFGSTVMPNRGASKGSDSQAVSPTYDSRPQSPNGHDFLPALTTDHTLSLALEPADRGKATAMGAFNKPLQQFDEHEYLERQQQLQNLHARQGILTDSAAAATARRQSGRSQSGRYRSNSNTSAQTRSRSVSASQPNSDKNKSTASTIHGHESTSIDHAPTGKGSRPDTHRTFFGDFDASESEDEHNAGPVGSDSSAGLRGWQSSNLATVSEHPALRGGQSSLQSDDHQGSPSVSKDDAHGRPHQIFVPKPFTDNKGIDSPTLGPGNGRALNGMVHHLRQRSNQSSIYPNDDDDDSTLGHDDSYGNHSNALGLKNTDLVPRSINGRFDTDSGIGSSTTQSNPWDLDDIDAFRDFESPIIGSSLPGKSQAPNVPHTRDDKLGSRLELGMPEMEPIVLPWQTELRNKHHLRDGSSATQQERDAFASELAARRTAIQENIKHMVAEGQGSRNASPARTPSSVALKALGRLKSKPSHEAFGENRGTREALTSTKPRHANAALLSNTAIGSTSDLEKTFLSGDGSRFRNVGHPAFQNADSRDRSASRPGIQTTSLQRPLQPGDCIDLDPGVAMDRSRGLPSHTTTRNVGTRSRSQSNATKDASRRGRSEARSNDVPSIASNTSSSRLPSTAPQGRDRDSGRECEKENISLNDRHEPLKGFSGASAMNRDFQMPRMDRTVSEPKTIAHMTMAASKFAVHPASAISAPPTASAQQTGHSMPPQRTLGNSLRKKSISKMDISEPTLISSTSNVDTVELPPGASLKNGMSEAPPLPPINPKRRVARKIFGLGRSESYENDSSNHSSEYGFGGKSRHSDSSHEEPMLRGAASTPNLTNSRSGASSTSPGRGAAPMSPNRLQAYEYRTDGNMF